jgi:hypothetical protein
MALLQFIGTQVVTFLLALFIPNFESFQQTQPALFTERVLV